MRTLFVGDLHAKADLLPLISRVAQRENTDRMVLLGDVCDDWNVSNNGLIRFFETFTSWYRREAGEREVIPLLGNHDVPYFLKQGSSSYARVRALAPGFKPGAHRKVHELMQNTPFQLAWSDGNILATHAGLTRAWGRRHPFRPYGGQGGNHPAVPSPVGDGEMRGHPGPVRRRIRRPPTR